MEVDPMEDSLEADRTTALQGLGSTMVLVAYLEGSQVYLLFGLPATLQLEAPKHLV